MGHKQVAMFGIAEGFRSRSNTTVMKVLQAAVLAILVGVKLPVGNVPSLYVVGCFSLVWAIPHLITGKDSHRLTLLLLLTSVCTLFVLFQNGHSLSMLFANQAFRLLVYVSAWKFISRTMKPSLTVSLTGLACGLGWLWIVNVPSLTWDVVWKYALAIPISILVMIMLSRFRWPIVLIGTFGLAVFSMSMGNRSMSIIIILAGIIYAFRKSDTRRSERRRLIASSVVLLAVLVASYLLVPNLAKDGVLGEAVMESFQRNAQVSENPLLGGRAELPVSLATAFVNPVFGWGVMPIATSEILSAAGNWADRLGIVTGPATDRLWVHPQNGSVLAHSVIMEMWISSGIFGLLSCLVIFITLIKLLQKLLFSQSNRVLPVVFISICLMWDILFAPFLAGRDILMAFIIVAAYGIFGRTMTSVVIGRSSGDMSKA